MGCISSKKASANIVPATSPNRKDSAASNLRSGLVGKVDKKNDISSTYDLGNSRVMGSGGKFNNLVCFISSCLLILFQNHLIGLLYPISRSKNIRSKYSPKDLFFVFNLFSSSHS